MQQELHDEPDNGLWWDSYTEFLSDPLLWGLYSKEKNVCIRLLPGFISRDTIEATPSIKQNYHLQVLRSSVEHLNI